MRDIAYIVTQETSLTEYRMVLHPQITITGQDSLGNDSQDILLVFQTVENYEPPIWSWQKGKQRQMAHIDFYVDNLEVAESNAIKHGATKSEIQHYNTSTVMFGPAWHPFYLSKIK